MARLWKASLWAIITAIFVYHATVEARLPRPFTLPKNQRDALIFLWPIHEFGFDASKMHQFLDRFALVGTKHIVVPYYGCQNDIYSSQVGECERVPESLAIQQAEVIRSRGFVVTFLPIVLTMNGGWRGDFVPTNVDLWFETYTRWIKKVAAQAEAYQMPELVVATEIKKLYVHTEHWKKLLREVRTVFSKPLIVTTNWDFLDIGFWDETDAIGISAYFPLSQSPWPTQNQLNQAAHKIRFQLKAIGEKYRRPVHLTEIGYPSLRSAAKTPWAFPGEPPERDINLKLQAKCFQALVDAWGNDPRLVHVGIWASSNYKNPFSRFTFEIIGKPAEEVIRNFFRLRAQPNR